MKNKILDFISTDLFEYYNVPIIIKPLQPYNPMKAKPSDHSIPLAKPKSTHENKKEKKTFVKRPMLDLNLSLFGKWDSTQPWEELETNSDINQMVEDFTNKIQNKVDDLFPQKTFTVPVNSKPWFNHELKELSKRKKMI